MLVGGSRASEHDSFNGACSAKIVTPTPGGEISGSNNQANQSWGGAAGSAAGATKWWGSLVVDAPCVRCNTAVWGAVASNRILLMEILRKIEEGLGEVAYQKKTKPRGGGVKRRRGGGDSFCRWYHRQ